MALATGIIALTNLDIQNYAKSLGGHIYTSSYCNNIIYYAATASYLCKYVPLVTLHNFVCPNWLELYTMHVDIVSALHAVPLPWCKLN